MLRNGKLISVLTCLLVSWPSFGVEEVVSSATGAWFAVDAREVKDTTWEGGAIIGGETNVVLQSSPNAWGEGGGGTSATITWASTSGGSGTIAAATTADSVLWTPEARFGTNTLTYVSGAVTKTATFVVRGLAGVESVTARQRYPWNGMVDIAFTVKGDADKYYAVSFVATNVSACTGLTMKTLLDEKGAALTSNAVKPGTYRWAWNAAADLPDGFKAERVAITVEAK